MPDGSNSLSFSRLASLLPWSQIFADLWELGKQAFNRLAARGIYQVLEHESTLELLDIKGKKATFHKRQKARYLQGNILAYQDQALDDGKILSASSLPACNIHRRYWAL